MVIGDNKWLEKVNQNYNFPCKVAFVMVKENDDSVFIVSTLIKSKSQLKNVKYSHISRNTWTSKGSAVLSIKELNNPEEYLKETLRLNDIWGFALSSKEEEKKKA